MNSIHSTSRLYLGVIGFLALTTLAVLFFFVSPLGDTLSISGSLFAWATTRTATAYFSVFIVLLALLAAWHYGRATTKLLDELGAAERIVGSETVSLDDLEDEFVRHAPSLQLPFASFRQTIHRVNNAENSSDFCVDDISVRQGFFALRSPRDYFNEDTTYRTLVNVPLYEAVPGMLTGLGIFFTFVGLACGVSLATDGLLPSNLEQAGVDAADVKSLLASIGDLLQGAGLAFVTSIAGLATSLWLSYWIHGREKKIRNALELLNEKFEALAPTADAETLLLASARKTSRQEALLRGLKDNWELMAEKFAAMLAEQVGKEVAKTSSAQTEELVRELRELTANVKRLGETQNQVLSDTVVNAMQKLVGMLAGTFKDMTDTLDKSAEGIRTAVAELDTILSTTKETMRSVSDGVDEGLGRMTEGLEAIETRLVQGAQQLETSMNAIVEQSELLLGNFTEAGASFKSSIQASSDGFGQAVTESASGFRTSVVETGNAFGETFATAVQQGTQALETGMSGMAEQSARLLNDVTEAGASFKRSIQTSSDSFGQAVTESASDFKASIVESGNAFGETFATAVQQGTQALETGMSGMAEQSARLLNDVTEAGASFRDSMQASSDSFGQSVTESAAGFKTSVSESGNAFGDVLGSAAENSARTLREAADDSAKEFQSAFVQAVEGADRFARSLEDSASTQRDLAQIYEEMGKKVSCSGDVLMSTIQECRLVLEALIENRDAFQATIEKILTQATQSQKEGTVKFEETAHHVTEALIYVLNTHQKLQESSDKLQLLLTDGVTRLDAALRNLYEQLSINMATADKALGSAVNDMSDGLRRWTQYQVEQSNALERNTQNFTKAIDRMGDLVQAVDTSVRRIETAQGSVQKADNSGNTDKVAK